MNYFPENEGNVLFDELFGVKKPIIGVVHLKPLPGSPKYENNIEDVFDFRRCFIGYTV